MDANYHWDRDGNTHWQVCPACGGQFPVSPGLAAADDIDMICPSCHHPFRPEKPAANSAAHDRGTNSGAQE